MDTREAIITTFMDLAQSKPMDKITVREIVAACDVNRNSFYYHFEDITDLMEKVIEEVLLDPDQNWKSQPPKTFILDLCRRINSSKDILSNAYFSKNHQLFERKLLNLVEDKLNQYFEYHVFSRMNLDKRQKSLVIYEYKCLIVGMVSDWMNHGMNYDVEERFSQIISHEGLAPSQLMNLD